MRPTPFTAPPPESGTNRNGLALPMAIYMCCSVVHEVAGGGAHNNLCELCFIQLALWRYPLFLAFACEGGVLESNPWAVEHWWI